MRTGIKIPKVGNPPSCAIQISSGPQSEREGGSERSPETPVGDEKGTNDRGIDAIVRFAQIGAATGLRPAGSSPSEFPTVFPLINELPPFPPWPKVKMWLPPDKSSLSVAKHSPILSRSILRSNGGLHS